MVDDPAATPVRVKLAEVCPAGTVIDAGTVALAVLELVSVTTRPPVGAGSDKVNGIERVKPGVTRAPAGRFNEMGRTVTATDPVTNPSACAWTVALPMATVVNVVVIELAPAGIVTANRHGHQIGIATGQCQCQTTRRRGRAGLNRDIGGAPYPKGQLVWGNRQ
jgi:hypothetical protein